MPTTWRVLNFSHGVVESAVKGLVLWHLTSVPLESEAVLIIGEPSPHLEPCISSIEEKDGPVDELEFELHYENTGRLDDEAEKPPTSLLFCRVYAGDKPAHKFVKPQSVEVILRQTIPIKRFQDFKISRFQDPIERSQDQISKDQISKDQVIRGAEELGTQQVLSRLVDGEELGCHRALLSLIAQQKRFRPDAGCLGPFSMPVWEQILEFAQTKAASRIAGIHEELAFAESQISGPEQSVRWCFDTLQGLTSRQAAGFTSPI